MRFTRPVLGESRQEGAIAVEMVLILPVLLLLVVGIVNFGYVFGQKLSLNQAVREGARMAVVPGQTPGGELDSTAKIAAKVQGGTGGLLPGSVQVVVKNQSLFDPADPTKGVISSGCKSLKVGDQLRVEATYTTSGILRGPLPVLNNSRTLTSAAVFRCEWQG